MKELQNTRTKIKHGKTLIDSTCASAQRNTMYEICCCFQSEENNPDYVTVVSPGSSVFGQHLTGGLGCRIKCYSSVLWQMQELILGTKSQHTVFSTQYFILCLISKF